VHNGNINIKFLKEVSLLTSIYLNKKHSKNINIAKLQSKTTVFYFNIF